MSLRGYILRRALLLLPLWVGVSAIAFAIGHLAPGDPGRAILGQRLGRPATDAEVRTFDHAEGLDRSLVAQYLSWLGNAARGDLGTSYQSKQSVSEALFSHLGATLLLATVALVLATAVAVPLGIRAARRAGTRTDTSLRVFSILSSSVPNFAVGYVLIIVFAVVLQVLPAQGAQQPASILLPAVTLAIPTVGIVLRLVRASMLQVTGEDFVRTARAKGVSETRVVYRHVLRNAAGAVITYIGLTYAELVAGGAVVEPVFAWPGIGLLLNQSIHQRDIPMIQGFVILAGTVFLLVNLAVDVAYMSLDPRVRLERAPA